MPYNDGLGAALGGVGAQLNPAPNDDSARLAAVRRKRQMLESQVSLRRQQGPNTSDVMKEIEESLGVPDFTSDPLGFLSRGVISGAESMFDQDTAKRREAALALVKSMRGDKGLSGSPPERYEDLLAELRGVQGGGQRFEQPLMDIAQRERDIAKMYSENPIEPMREPSPDVTRYLAEKEMKSPVGPTRRSQIQNVLGELNIGAKYAKPAAPSPAPAQDNKPAPKKADPTATTPSVGGGGQEFQPREPWPTKGDERRDRLIEALEKEAFDDRSPGILGMIATALAGAVGGYKGQPGLGMAVADQLTGKASKQSARQSLASIYGREDSIDAQVMRALSAGARGKSPEQSSEEQRGRQLLNAGRSQRTDPELGQLEQERDRLVDPRNPQNIDPKVAARVAELERLIALRKKALGK